MAVDREFYVYRFGRPRPGRTDGRAEGRIDGGRADGRADRRKGCFERQYNDFHRFFQKTTKNDTVFWLSESCGGASTDFYSSNEKCVQKPLENIMIFDFSNHARAQVPIFTPKMKKMGTASELLGASQIHRKRDTERGAEPPEHSRQRSGWR